MPKKRSREGCGSRSAEAANAIDVSLAISQEIEREDWEDEEEWPYGDADDRDAEMNASAYLPRSVVSRRGPGEVVVCSSSSDRSAAEDLGYVEPPWEDDSWMDDLPDLAEEYLNEDEEVAEDDPDYTDDVVNSMCGLG